ncbi:MAG TPA: hypothetical protein VIJ47_14275 [Acidimicrobiales bacterium]
MARSSNAAAPARPRWVRRLRRLAILGTVIALLAATREQVLRRDQRRFDAQYGTRS